MSPLPEAFCERMQELLTKDEYAAFLSSYGQKRRYSLRINPLKTDPDKAAGLLQKALDAYVQVGGLVDDFLGKLQKQLPDDKENDEGQQGG